MSEPNYTVAYWEANQSTIDGADVPFTITDMAANISGALNGLDGDSLISAIYVSDNAAVTVSVNQLFVTDTHAIGLLQNANSTAYTLVVSDTGANITGELNNLEANTHVTSVVVGGGIVDATVAQLASDSTVLSILKTTGGAQASFAIDDTATNIHGGWANIAADSQISSIVVSDNNQISLTATQASETSTVEKLVDANSNTSNIVLVKDTAAHIEADLSSLNTVASFIASVTVSNSTFETLSAGQVTSDLAILEKVVFSSGPASFAVSDSSVNVSANLNALESLSGSISSITVTDNSPITVSIAQLSNDTDALSLMTYDSNSVSVAILDTGNNISGNLATLEAAIQAASPPITSITVSGGEPINVTITQFSSDSAVFSALTGSYTLNVSDTASNISGDLNALQTLANNGNISAINVTDSGAISVSVAQITSDAAALAELVNRDTNPYTLDVTDSAANVEADLVPLGTNSHVAAITLTDATPVLSITGSQFISGLAALGEITNGSFAIDVTTATAAQAATIATDFTGLSNESDATLSIVVSDTASHISGALVALGSNTYVNTIALSDGNPLSLTEANFTNAGYDAGLAKMTGTYTVDVTGVTVAQVSTVENVTGLGGTPTLSIAVSDSGSNITNSALQSLGSDSKIASITVTGPIVLSESQFTSAADDAGLVKMIGSYTVAVYDVSVAQVATVEGVTGLGGTPTLFISVSDIGANITSSALVSLGGDGNVAYITVSDSNPILLTEAQFTNAADHAGLAKMINSYTVDVTGVTVAEVGTVEGVSGLGGSPTLSIAVSDLGANITNIALQGLGSDSKIASISVTSGAISLTEAQFTNADTDAGLDKMTGSYTVDVSGVTVAEVSTVEGVTGLGGTPTLSIAVSDTASQITGALSTLGSDNDVTSIAVNNGNPITLAEATFVSDSAGLGKMTGSYTVQVTGVTVAQVSTVEGITLGGTPSLEISVSDSGTAVSAALSTLGSDPDVALISLNGGFLSLTGANYTASGYDAGLAKMTGTYTVDVTGVTVAELSAVEGVTGLGGTPTVSIAVSDTGAHLTSAALVSLGSTANVTSIAVTTGAISLTEAQYTTSGDQAGLAKMTGTYTVDVTGVTVAQVSTVEAVTGLGGTPTLSIEVSDTGSDITAGKLISLGADSKVTSIAVTSGVITLTQGEYASTSNEYAGLLKMTGAYTVDVTGVGVAYVSTVEALAVGGTPTLSIAVVDIGSRFTNAKLVAFGADSSVTSITVTSGAVTLTEAQFTAAADHAALAKFTVSYTVDVTGVTVAQLPTVEGATGLGGTPTLSIAVSDTGANLSSFEIGILGSDNDVTSIAVTSGALTFNESQFTSSGAGFAKMTGTYTVDVSGVTVAQVSTVEGISLAGSATLSIAVSDSGTNITSAELVSLGSNANVTSIAVTGGAISLTEAQFVADSAGLGKLTGAYTIDVTGVTYAQVATVDGTSLPGTPTLSIAVSDTGGDLTSAALVSLGSNTNVTSIAVTGGAISLTEAQFVADSAGLGKLTGAYTVDVSGVSVAQVPTVEGISLGGSPTLSISVSDTTADITGALATLGADGHVTKISLTDGNSVTLSVNTFETASVTTALAELYGENASLASVTISDTAADITGDLGAINSDTQITKIVVSDNGLTSFTVAELTSYSRALGELYGSNGTTPAQIEVSDTANAIAGAFDTLNGMTNIGKIIVNNSNIGQYPDITAEQGANDTYALSHLYELGGTTPYQAVVYDTGTAFLNYLSGLEANSAYFYDVQLSTTATLTITAAQFESNETILNKIQYWGGNFDVTGVTTAEFTSVAGYGYTNPTHGISLSDTAAHIVADLSTLESYAGYINTITLTDAAPPTITLGYAAFTAAETVLGDIVSPYDLTVTGVTVADVSIVEGVSLPNATLSIAVSDTGADITASKLISLGADSKVTSIAVTSGVITLTQGEYASTSNEYAGLLKMTGAYTVDVTGVGVAFVSTIEALAVGGTPTLSIAVADIGARFTGAELTTLGADSRVTSITVTSGAITLTEAQYVASGEHAGLAKVAGAYTVDVTGVTVAKVATVEAVTGLGGTPTLSIAVSDTGANLTSSALSTLGADGKVTSIAVTSGAIALTEGQFTGSASEALDKMTGSYTVDISGVSVAEVATVEGRGLGGTPTLSIAVSDIGSNFTSAELVTLGADSKVTSIAVTSGVIALTGTQYLTSGDEAGLTKITGSYTVDVSSVAVAQVSAIEAYQPGSITLSIAVSDTGGNITSSALSTLGDDSKVASIAVTTGAITLTESQFVAAADDAGLAKMTGAYAIDVRSVTAAQVVTVEGIALGGTPTLSIAVSDGGANLTSVELVSLGANANVTSIAVTSGVITLTEAQFTNSNDDLGLAKLTGAYTVDVTGVTVTQVSTVEGVTGLGGTPTLSIAVSDTGADVSPALSTLGSDNDVTSIALSSGVITLGETVYTNAGYDAGLAKMTGSYTVDVSAVTVAEVSTVEGVTGLGGSPTLSIAVIDTGAHLTAAALSALGSDPDVTSIQVSVGVISLTADQFTSAGEDAGLAKMDGGYTVDVTSATVAQVATIEAVTLKGAPTLRIAVSDTGANISSAALVSFGTDNDVTSIAVSDSNPITLTEAQYTAAADDAGLAKMTGTYTVDVTGVTVAQVGAVEAISGLGGTPTLSIAVSDIGGNFTNTVLTNLGSDPDVTSIAVSSGAISLTEAQFTTSGVDAGFDKVTGSYTVDVSGVSVANIPTVEGITLPGTPTLSIAVSDTGSAISGDFAGLGGDADVTSIAVTTGVISLAESAYSVTNDLAALGKMTGSYTVDVSGVSVAQVSTVEGATYGGTPTLSIAVSDIGGDITDAALQSLGADPDVTSIAVTGGGGLDLTVPQFTGTAEAAGLAKMTGAYTVFLTNVTVAEVSAVESQTGLGGTPTLQLEVVDFGTAFTGTVLTNLGNDPDVVDIVVFSGAISLSESHFTNAGVDAGLAKVVGSYTVDVANVTVAEVSTVEGVTGLGGNPTLSIAVSDIGSNITDAALQTLGADNDVTSIAVTSGAIALTAAQYLGTPEDAGLAKMKGSYTVDVSGATVAQVAAIEGTSVGGNPTLSIAVSDTGSDITSAALVSLGADNNVASIADTGGAITLTESQFVNANDVAGLAKMTGSYAVDVTGVTVAQVSVVESQTGLSGRPTVSIDVVDTGAHINDAALQTLGGTPNVVSIQVSSGAISLTESQFTGTPEEAGLAKMTGSYTVDVSGVSVAQVSAVEGVSTGGAATLSIAVVDAGSTISGDLSSLGGDGDVTSIAVSGGNLSLTESEYTVANDLTALGKMTGAYTVNVTGVAVAQISTVEDATYGGTPTLSIAVSDTGADITSAALVSMGSDNDVTSITVTGGVISLTEAQFVAAADVKGLEKVTSGFTVDVTGVTAAQVATVTTDFGNLTNTANGTLSIAVSDTAAHVASNAPALNTNTDVTSVVVTDTAAHVATDLDILNGVAALTAITLTDATPVLTLTESQFAGGLLALDTVQNTSVTMDVTGATAAQAATVLSDFLGLSDDLNFSTFTIAVADNSTNVANDASALNANASVTSIHVTDSEANLDANIDALDTVTALTAITITNATPALSLTAVQVEDAAAALAVITNTSFTLDATGASAAQAASIVSEISGLSDASHITYAIGVSDTAANIALALNNLENEHVSSLTISDSNPLDITYAQFQADSSVLSTLTGTDTVNVSGVTGQAYGSFTDTYINGSVAETIENNTNGSFTTIGYVNDLTFTPTGPGSTAESITQTTGTHGDTFVFSGSFGNVSITGFAVGNDAIQFNTAEFANVAAVEQHTTLVNGNAVVTLDSGDTITLVGVTVNSFEAHSTDWTFG